jgi:hypothetical protein
VLRRISVLLVPQFFGKETDAAQLATKQKLLDEETSRYIIERGGNECGRIRYGRSVKLAAVGTGRRVYYSPNRSKSKGPALYDRDPSEALDPGGAEATFVVHPAGRTTDEDVMAGDSLVLQLKDAKLYLTFGRTTATVGQFQGQLIGKIDLSPQPVRAEGEYSLRIRGSGQATEGSEMQEKRRPLVSGDVVMIARRDAQANKYFILTTPLGLPFGGVMLWNRPSDELLAQTVDMAGRDYFVIRNA